MTGNVRAAVIQRQNPDGTFTTIGVFTDLSDVVIPNLVPGSTNTLRAGVMAASNQASEWCNPMTVICT